MSNSDKSVFGYESDANVVYVELDPYSVLTAIRSADDLIITLRSNKKINVEGYFSSIDLVLFRDPDGGLWQLLQQPENGLFFFKNCFENSSVLLELNYLVSGLSAFKVASLLSERDDEEGRGLISSQSNSVDQLDSQAGRHSDTTAPSAATDLAVSGKGTVLTGRGEAGAFVAVTHGGKTYDALVGADGIFRVALDPAATIGDALTVVLTDASGNSSPPASVTTPAWDTTAPSAATDLAVSGKGTVLTGRGEAGAFVTVTHGGKTYDALVGTDDIFRVALDPAAVNEDEITVSLHDASGNASDETVLIVTGVDRDAPLAPQIIGFDVSGTILKGKGEAFAEVVLVDRLSGEVVGQAVVSEDGTFSIKVTPLANNGDLFAATQTDTAGNVSLATHYSASGIDRDPPEPAIYTVHVNATETYLKGTGEAGARITYRLNDGTMIHGGFVSADGTFRVDYNGFVNRGDRFSVTLTDDAGNVSAERVQIVTVVDRSAPSILTLMHSVNGLALQGSTDEAVERVKVWQVTKDPASGEDIYTLVSDFSMSSPSKNFYIPMTEPVSDGEIFQVIAVDVAGNSSPPRSLQVVGVDTNAPAAVDNNYSLVLDVTPTSRQGTPSQKTSFAVADLGLGSVLDVGLLDFSKQMQVQVADNTARVLTLHADAGGVALLSKFNLKVLKKVDGLYWETFQVFQNFLEVAAFGAKSSTISLYLPPGEYAMVVEAAAGVRLLTGYTLYVSNEEILDFGTPENLAGHSSGNVIADYDPVGGRDYLPGGVGAISEISFGSVTLGVVAGTPTQITGDYGVLTISADGSWSYRLNDSLGAAIFDQVERFSYVLQIDPHTQKTADLIITLTPDEPEPVLSGQHDRVVLDVDAPRVATSADKRLKDQTNFSLLDLANIESVLSLSAIDATASNIFTVGAQQLRSLVLSAEGGGITANGRYDLVVYRQSVMADPNAPDGVATYWVEYLTHQDFLRIAFLAGSAEPQLFNFTEGTYAVMLAGSATLGLATGTTLTVEQDWTTDYSNPSNASGQSDGQLLKEGATGSILSVEGQSAGQDGTWILSGEHGVLNVRADGSYTYTYNGSVPVPYGATELFRYAKVENGATVSTSLSLTLGMTDPVVHSHEFDVDVSNRVETYKAAQAEKDALGSPVIKGTFEVAEQSHSFLTFEGHSRSLADYYQSSITLRVYKAPSTPDGALGALVFEHSSLSSTSSTIPLTDFGLMQAGSYVYEISLNRTHGSTIVKWGYDLQVHTVYDAEYVPLDKASPGVASGQLLDAAQQALWGDKIIAIEIGGRMLQFGEGIETGPDQLQITGQFGTLTLLRDGSYSYVSNGVSFGTESFGYHFHHAAGPSTSGTLNFTTAMDVTPVEEVSHVASSAYQQGTSETFVLDDLTPTPQARMARLSSFDDTEDDLGLEALDEALAEPVTSSMPLDEEFFFNDDAEELELPWADEPQAVSSGDVQEAALETSLGEALSQTAALLDEENIVPSI